MRSTVGIPAVYGGEDVNIAMKIATHQARAMITAWDRVKAKGLGLDRVRDLVMAMDLARDMVIEIAKAKGEAPKIFESQAPKLKPSNFTFFH